MDDLAPYLILLGVAIALTFFVGRLLVTAGEPFLQEVFHERSVSHSVNLLLSVLFHLITLGVLAIVSVVNLGSFEENPVQAFVVRFGVVLIVLGVAYGISMLVLIRIRERRRADQISEHVQERLADRGVDARPVDHRYDDGFLPPAATGPAPLPVPPTPTHPIPPRP